MKKFDGFVFLLFIFVAFIVRFNSLSVPLERDEGEYAYASWAITQGKSWYTDFFIQKPPAIIYTYFLSQKIFGQNDWGYRTLSVLFLATTAFFIFLIVKNRSQTTGIAFGFFYLVLISLPVPLLWNGAANTELFLNAFLTGALWISLKKTYRTKDAVILALLLCISILYKPICIGLVLAIFGLFIAKTPSINRIQTTMIILGAGLAICFLLLLPLHSIENIKSMIESAVLYNRYYAQNYGWDQCISNGLYFWKIFKLLIIILIISIVWIKKIKNLQNYWFIFVFGFLFILKAPIPRYYLILFPVVVLLFSEFFMFWHEKYLHWVYIPFTLMLLSIVYPWRANYVKNEASYLQSMYPRENMIDGFELAKWLNLNIKPTESLYIIGSEPQLYYYTQKTSPTRFITKYPLQLSTPVALQYQLEELDQIQKKLPDWIVYSTNYQSFLYTKQTPALYFDQMHDLLKTKYHKKHVFSDQYIVYKRI